MISPNDFISRWAEGGDSPVRFPAASVDRLAIAAEDKAFLIQAGLPTDAAPFLTFDAPPSGDLPTVAAQWGVADRFRQYRVIGSDGAGNPIAFDEARQGEVVCLDHESGFARALMNTTVRQFAESLLAYRKLIRQSQAEFGPDAFLDGKTSPAARQSLRDELTAIDPAAVKPGTFWQRELQNLDASAG